MQIIRCKKCSKVLFEIEGQAHVKKVCPKCKTMNDINVGQIKAPKFTDKIINK